MSLILAVWLCMRISPCLGTVAALALAMASSTARAQTEASLQLRGVAQADCVLRVERGEASESSPALLTESCNSPMGYQITAEWIGAAPEQATELHVSNQDSERALLLGEAGTIRRMTGATRAIQTALAVHARDSRRGRAAPPAGRLVLTFIAN